MEWKNEMGQSGEEGGMRKLRCLSNDEKNRIHIVTGCLLPLVVAGLRRRRAFAFRRDGFSVAVVRPGGIGCCGLYGRWVVAVSERDGLGTRLLDCGVLGFDRLGGGAGGHRFAAGVWLRGFGTCAVCADRQFLQSGAVCRLSGHGTASVPV